MVPAASCAIPLTSSIPGYTLALLRLSIASFQLFGIFNRVIFGRVVQHCNEDETRCVPYGAFSPPAQFHTLWALLHTWRAARAIEIGADRGSWKIM